VCLVRFLVVLVPVVESLRAIVLVGIILIGTVVLDVVLVVHLLRGLLGMSASLDLVILVHSFCFSKFVDLAANEAREKFLGELVRDRLACVWLEAEGALEGLRRHTFLALVVFPELETLEGGSTCNQLMRELGLIVVALVALVVILTVNLLMSILSVVCNGLS
jgi:hypothetical protein